MFFSWISKAFIFEIQMWIKYWNGCNTKMIKYNVHRHCIHRFLIRASGLERGLSVSPSRTSPIRWAAQSLNQASAFISVGRFLDKSTNKQFARSHGNSCWITRVLGSVKFLQTAGDVTDCDIVVPREVTIPVELAVACQGLCWVGCRLSVYGCTLFTVDYLEAVYSAVFNRWV